MKTYAMIIGNRKELTKRIEALTGERSVYTFMPRCAYEIGAFAVEKDGTLTAQDDADQSVIDTLQAEGMIGEEIIAESIEAVEPEQTDETAEPEQPAPPASTDEWDDDEDDNDEDSIEGENAEAEEQEETEEAEDEPEESEENADKSEPAAEPEAAPPVSEDAWDDEPEDEPGDEPEETTELPEPLTAEISFPLSQHTVQSLTNLICMIHPRRTSQQGNRRTVLR